MRPHKIPTLRCGSSHHCRTVPGAGADDPLSQHLRDRGIDRLGRLCLHDQIRDDLPGRADQQAEARIQAERDEIGVLRAEWAHLARPERIQELATKYLDLQPLSLNQIVAASAIPERSVRVDTIGRKLETLGLAEPTNTPRGKTAPSATTTPGRVR